MSSRSNNSVVYEDPPIARLLFSDTRLSWLWLAVRLYLAYSWLTSGWGKLNNAAWTQSGEALRSYWASAIAIPASGKPAITFDWYRDFLTFMLNGGHYVWFSKLVVFGELAIGTAMLVGAFVGIAAFFNAFMNWNFLMAGSASVNPVLMVLAIGLVLSWKTAGYIGLDRWLLHLVGTPWAPGAVFPRAVRTVPVAATEAAQAGKEQVA